MDTPFRDDDNVKDSMGEVVAEYCLLDLCHGNGLSLAVSSRLFASLDESIF